MDQYKKLSTKEKLEAVIDVAIIIAIWIVGIIVGTILSSWGPIENDCQPNQITSTQDKIYWVELPKLSIGAAGESPVIELPATEVKKDPIIDLEPIKSALVRVSYLSSAVPLPWTLQQVVHTTCEDTGVDYTVALGLIEVGSQFHEDAVAPISGCYGLCQLDPRYFPTGLSSKENVENGLDYLRQCLERYDDDLEAALTAYYAGYDDGSRAYARAVLEAAEKWKICIEGSEP